MNKQSGRIGLYLVLIVMLVAGYFYLNNQVASQSSYSMESMKQAAEDGKLSSAKIYQNREVPTGSVVADIEGEGQKKVYVTDVKDAQKLLEGYGIHPEVADVPQESVFMTTFFPVLLTGGLVIFLFLMMNRQMSGGGGNAKMMNFGKSRARMMLPDDKKVTFQNVAGLQEEKEDLVEVVDFLKAPQKYTNVGARIPKGVILVGPPGTGKTLLAKAVAGEAGVPFFSISGSDFVEMFVGVGASRVRDLFEEGKKHAPCIIFIDEIDAVARQRGTGMGGGHDEREQTLNQLLVEMDGFGVNEGIIVMAATNRVDILDPAILRPGRFDRKVAVGRPDIKGREEILRVHAKDKPLGEDVDLAQIAQTTAGFTGADLENLLNEAALLAARKNKTLIGMDEIEEAFTKVVAGPQKKSMRIKESEKLKTAYHEAGHAVLSHVLPLMDPVHQISIIPSGNALGYTLNLPEEDKYSVYRNELKQKISMLLGGRVAEQLIFDDFSGGASNDIQRATQIARKMVMQLGMSDLGPILFGSGHSDSEVFLGRDFSHERDFSEAVAAQIDEQIEKIITDAYNEAKRLLTENIDKLHFVAKFLCKNEIMDGEQFRRAMEEDGVTFEELEEMVAEKRRRSESENAARALQIAENERLREEERRRNGEVGGDGREDADREADGDNDGGSDSDSSDDHVDF